MRLSLTHEISKCLRRDSFLDHTSLELTEALRCGLETLVTDINQRILLVGDEDRIPEVVTRLARVGYDHAIGYLEGGVEAWKADGKELDSIESISADEFAAIESEDKSIKNCGCT